MATDRSTPESEDVKSREVQTERILLRAPSGQASIIIGFREPDERWPSEAGRPFPLPHVTLRDQYGEVMVRMEIHPGGPGVVSLLSGSRSDPRHELLEIAGNEIYFVGQGDADDRREAHWPMWKGPRNPRP